jgi:hypothetical protein
MISGRRRRARGLDREPEADPHLTVHLKGPVAVADLPAPPAPPSMRLSVVMF